MQIVLYLRIYINISKYYLGIFVAEDMAVVKIINIKLINLSFLQAWNLDGGKMLNVWDKSYLWLLKLRN